MKSALQMFREEVSCRQQLLALQRGLVLACSGARNPADMGSPGFVLACLLTFFAHSDAEAFLQTAVLTLVAVMLVDLTFPVGSAQRETKHSLTKRFTYLPPTPPAPPPPAPPPPPPFSVTPVMSELCEPVGLKSYQGCDLCKSLALHAPALPFTAGRGLPTFHREHFQRLKKTLSKQPRLFIMWGGGEEKNIYSEAEAAVSMSREQSCNILFLQ